MGVIFVDVDGTLLKLVEGPNMKLIRWLNNRVDGYGDSIIILTNRPAHMMADTLQLLVNLGLSFNGIIHSNRLVDNHKVHFLRELKSALVIDDSIRIISEANKLGFRTKQV